MTYDEKCWDLAKIFLIDSPFELDDDEAHVLAQVIQRAIEDHLSILPIPK